jgi:macrolide-specific efflux system membrane fusion protein
MTVRAQVAEADVMRLRVGTDVEFTTLGALERRWHGQVRQVLPSPEVINDVVLYNVLVDVDNRDRQLMNGMSTQIFFILGRVENALAVPTSALGRRRPEQDQNDSQAYEVRVREGDRLATRVVQVGHMSRQWAEVRQGLAEGEAVAVPRRAAPKTAPRRSFF